MILLSAAICAGSSALFFIFPVKILKSITETEKPNKYSPIHIPKVTIVYIFSFSVVINFLPNINLFKDSL